MIFLIFSKDKKPKLALNIKNHKKLHLFYIFVPLKNLSYERNSVQRSPK